MARNAGAVALARTGKSQTQIASEIGVSIVTAHQWMSGEKKPGPANRAKLLQRYGIALVAWDEKPAAKKPTAKAVAPPVAQPASVDAAAIGGAFALARELEQMARDQMAELRDEGRDEQNRSTPLERARVMASIAATLNVLAKITGQYDLGRRLLQLPLWRRIEAELAAALDGHPAAAAAIAERFSRLEAAEHAG